MYSSPVTARKRVCFLNSTTDGPELSGLSLKVRSHCIRWSQYILFSSSPQHFRSIFAVYMTEPARASRNKHGFFDRTRFVAKGCSTGAPYLPPELPKSSRDT